MSTSHGPDDRPPIIARSTRIESAAMAGIVYAILAVVALVLLRQATTPTAAEWDDWVADDSNRRSMGLALALASVAAVAFLWFVAVVRRRVGDREDRFFATVFLGSALVQITVWLVGVAVLAAPALSSDAPDAIVTPEGARLAEGVARALLLVVAPRLQAVFVASTSTIFLRTRVVPDWLAYLGYAVALAMFVIPIVTSPVGLGLPVFVLVASIVILVIAETGPRRQRSEG